jgi:hypothetical protein
MSIKVTVKGDRVNFSRWSFALMASTWRSRIAPVVLDALRQEAPVYKYDDPQLSRGQKPGDLKKSIKLDTVGGGIASAEMVFVSDVPYAGYVVSGTRGHPIPKEGGGAKTLRWTRNGVTNYRRSVQHPGTHANNFPQRAITAVGPAIGRTLELTVSEYIKPEQL